MGMNEYKLESHQIKRITKRRIFSMGMNEYKLESQPLCSDAAAVKGDTYRITVLTPALIRLEYNAKGIFEDRATQSVLNRNLNIMQKEFSKTVPLSLF